MELKFTKMHGCGNDYIYINCFDQTVEDPAALAVSLSRPHFGVGSDGVILICPSDTADAKMRMFNADGSEGKMCGNGIRCVGKYLYDNGMAGRRTEVTVETLSGIKRLHLTAKDGKMLSARVDMGRAVLSPPEIPRPRWWWTKRSITSPACRWATRTASYSSRKASTCWTCAASARNLKTTRCSPSASTPSLSMSSRTAD